jgi:hypothetical protein
MIFKTLSGSSYELDAAHQRVRRLSGPKDPQPRQGADGEWKAYVVIMRLSDGLFFDWNGYGNGTLTSPISDVTWEMILATPDVPHGSIMGVR